MKDKLALDHHPTKMNLMPDFGSLCSPYLSLLRQPAIFTHLAIKKDQTLKYEGREMKINIHIPHLRHYEYCIYHPST